jgi:hypothetical protein
MQPFWKPVKFFQNWKLSYKCKMWQNNGVSHRFLAPDHDILAKKTKMAEIEIKVFSTSRLKTHFSKISYTFYSSKQVKSFKISWVSVLRNLSKYWNSSRWQILDIFFKLLESINSFFPMYLCSKKLLVAKTENRFKMATKNQAGVI